MSIERFVVASPFLKKAFTLLFFVLFPFASSAPVHPGSIEGASALKYMKRYGYLPKGTLRSDDPFSLSDAIKSMQRFGNISQTGVIDDETLMLMASPRCGEPDVIPHEDHRRGKRYALSRHGGWRKRDITYLLENSPSYLGKWKVSKELKKAFDAWSGHARLNTRQIYDRPADIVISFAAGAHGNCKPFDGPHKTLAHATLPSPSYWYEGFIHFDADENWKIGEGNSGEGYDLSSTALHEVGHSLGLNHSDVRGSVMFAYYRGMSSQLQEDDIRGIRQLYNRAKGWENDVNSNNIDRGYRMNNGISGSSHSTFPDICDGTFDAVSVFRGQLFFFKGKYVWQLTGPGNVVSGYPMEIQKYFHGLPGTVTRIDAAYERGTDGKTIILTGNQYWIYNGVRFIEGSPRPLTDYGFSPEVDKIDVAVVSAEDAFTYLYSEQTKVRFDEKFRKYRRETNIDGAIKWRGYTLYSKEELFRWMLANFPFKKDVRQPSGAEAQHWFGCPERRDTTW